MPRLDVAVVIPAHDRRHLIGETLDSVLAQGHPAREVVVVDDGSTDGTADFVAARYPAVTLVRQARAGVCAARNAGVAASAAPWIAFCDSDDLWRPDHLALRAELHSRHPELRFSFGDCRLLVDGRIEPRTKFQRAPDGMWAEGRPALGGRALLLDTDLLPRLLRFQPILQPTLLVARNAFRAIGGYDRRLGFTLSEDFEFTLRCLALRPVGIVLEPTATVRKHPGNWSRDVVDGLLGEVAVLRHVADTHAAAAPHRDAIERECRARLAAALDGAFAARRFALARRIGRALGWRGCSWRRRAKLALAHAPEALAAAIAQGIDMPRAAFGRRPP